MLNEAAVLYLMRESNWLRSPQPNRSPICSQYCASNWVLSHLIQDTNGASTTTTFLGLAPHVPSSQAYPVGLMVVGKFIHFHYNLIIEQTTN